MHSVTPSRPPRREVSAATAVDSLQQQLDRIAHEGGQRDDYEFFGWQLVLAKDKLADLIKNANTEPCGYFVDMPN